jgi:hypothetical protein
VESSEDVTSELGSSDEHLVWRFALPEFGSEDTYAALAWRPREPRNWGRASGLVLSLGAAEEMRLTLELRTTTDNGDTVSWHHSVKVSDSQVLQALPWAQWRRRIADPRSGTQLRSGYGLEAFSDSGPTPEDLRRVTSLFFIATPEILEPGSAEEVQILELGVYGRR